MSFKNKLGRFLAWLSFIVSSLMMLVGFVASSSIAFSGLSGFLIVAFFYTCIAFTHVMAFKYIRSLEKGRLVK